MLVLVTTEDDLRRCAQSGAAFAGAVLKRAQEVAEQVLGSRDQARRDARRRAENLTRDGKHAAAEVLGTLRREFLVLLEDMEHLERTLRGANVEAPEAPDGPEAEKEKPVSSGRARTTRPPSSRPAGSSRPRSGKATNADAGPASRRSPGRPTEGRGR